MGITSIRRNRDLRLGNQRDDTPVRTVFTVAQHQAELAQVRREYEAKLFDANQALLNATSPHSEGVPVADYQAAVARIQELEAKLLELHSSKTEGDSPQGGQEDGAPGEDSPGEESSDSSKELASGVPEDGAQKTKRGGKSK